MSPSAASTAAAPHAAFASGPQEGASSHRRSVRQLLRTPSALAIAAALLAQAPTAAAFALSAGGGPPPRLHALAKVHGTSTRPVSLYTSPTCTLSAEPDLRTLVRSAGNSVVSQFREIGVKTTGFLRGGKLPAHEQAMQTSKDLAYWLESHADCNLALWGIGKAKRPEHLLSELRSGESFLRADGKRAVKVAKVRVFDGDYELVEVSQILGAKLEDGVVSGGVLKERHGRHLAEKFKPGETPLVACGRGIAEELEQYVGSNPVIHVLNENGKVAAWEEKEVSTSYPGLSCVYQLYFLECEVQGLNRAATGMTFFTGEDCQLDGHCDKVHVWEWRQREWGPTVAPEGCSPIEATLWSMH